MAPRFYSKEWVEAVKQKANSDPEYLKKTKGFTTKFLFVVTDCPDGNDVKCLWEYNQGKVTRYEYTTKKAPSDMRIGKEKWDESISLIKTQVSYAVFAKVQKREMTALGAIGAKLWNVEGDMIKAMAYQAYTTVITDLSATIPCEY
ncbi:MAG TPA: hypothetical protein VJ441_03630 [Dehalococcoidia bacterium]|nr:hypothetical protein [Dehalococcoidia bacterium]